MQRRLYWNKPFFSNTYSIYAKDKRVGYLKEKPFSKSVYGQLNGKQYIFRNTGFFSQKTKIIDGSSNKVIGEISYNSWMTKANILAGNKEVKWKYDNIWHTKWRMILQEDTIITYASSSTRGTIETNTDDELLLLSGLYIKNYYTQWIAVLIAIMVPLLITNS